MANTIYRLTVFDDDGKTPLTPRDASIHNDGFVVWSRDVSGSGTTGRPYMRPPSGRNSGIDILSRKTDIGQLTVDVLDKREGTNTERWVTAFAGDDEGYESLSGRRVLVEHNTNPDFDQPTAGLVPFFTGEITRVQTKSKLETTLFIREISHRLDIDVFTDEPSVDYATFAPLWPLGAIEFGNRAENQNRAGLPGIVRHGSNSTFYIESSDLVPGSSFVTARIVNSAFVDALNENNTPVGSFDQNPGRVGRTVKVRVTLDDGRTGAFDVWYYRERRFVRGMATAGDYVFAETSTRKAGADEYDILEGIGIRALPSDDPDHLAIPVDGTAVTFRVDSVATEPSSDTPLLISNVHPVQLWKDMLQGRFSTHNPNGTPRFSFDIDGPAFDALVANLDVPTFRGIITEKSQLNDWVEDNICVPYNLSYHIDGSGAVVPVDMSLPSKADASLPILSEEHLVGSGPRWSNDRTQAITRIDFSWQYARNARFDEQGGLSSTGLIVSDEKTLALNPTSIGTAENTFVIDGAGLTAIEGDRLEISPGVFVNTKSRDIYNYIRKRLGEFRSPFSAGIQSVRADVLDSAATSIQRIYPGRLLILDFPTPNPASNTKAGRRLAWCVGVSFNGLTRTMDFVDIGNEGVATAPVMGTLSRSTTYPESQIAVPVTLNSDGEPVEVEYALTDTTITSRPTMGWGQFDTITESGTVTIGDLPSGTRVWVRGRSSPDFEHEVKLPSPWSYPSNNYINTKAFTGPTSGAHSDVTGCSFNVTWTNTNTLPIELTLTRKGEMGQVRNLPAGTTRFAAVPVLPNSEYTYSVRYVDASGGRSAASTGTVTTGSADDSPAPRHVSVLIG